MQRTAIRIGLGLGLAIIASACVGSPGPASTPVSPVPPGPTANVGSAPVSPAPAAAPASSPTKAAPSTAAAPPADPLDLTDEQLARARAVQRHVVEAAAAYDVDPNLINGIIWAESKFNPKARNRSGARGLMQLMPGTSKAMARALERSNRPYDPSFSIHAGTHLYARLRDKFGGDEELALFGYARGSGGVRAWQERGGPMPEGVQKFIARVRRAQATFRSLGFPEAGGARPMAHQPSRASSSPTSCAAIASCVTTFG